MKKTFLIFALLASNCVFGIDGDKTEVQQAQATMKSNIAMRVYRGLPKGGVPLIIAWSCGCAALAGVFAKLCNSVCGKDLSVKKWACVSGLCGLGWVLIVPYMAAVSNKRVEEYLCGGHICTGCCCAGCCSAANEADHIG